MTAANFRYLFLMAFLFCSGRTLSQTADTPAYRSYFKTNLTLLALNFTTSEWYSIGVQYERSIVKGRKFTMALSVDYLRPKEYGSYPVSGFENTTNLMLFVRPQVRYYFGRQAFKGSYVGMFPLYNQIDYPYHKGNMWGGGVVTGYQFMVAKKFPVDLSAWVGHQSGDVIEFGESDSLEWMHKSYPIAFLDVNVGLPLGRKR